MENKFWDDKKLASGYSKFQTIVFGLCVLISSLIMSQLVTDLSVLNYFHFPYGDILLLFIFLTGTFLYLFLPFLVIISYSFAIINKTKERHLIFTSSVISLALPVIIGQTIEQFNLAPEIFFPKFSIIAFFFYFVSAIYALYLFTKIFR